MLITSLHWRHNDHDCVSNHQPHGCLLNRLFRRRSKKTLKLRVSGLCVGNSPGPVNSPHKGPNVSIWWRHHVQHFDYTLSHTFCIALPARDCKGFWKTVAQSHNAFHITGIYFSCMQSQSTCRLTNHTNGDTSQFGVMPNGPLLAQHPSDQDRVTVEDFDPCASCATATRGRMGHIGMSASG